METEGGEDPGIARRLAALIDRLGRVDGIGRALRWLARRYREDSVTTIRTGEAAGLLWRRHRRYVNSYWLGNYELTCQLALARRCIPGQVFFDVGANAGFFTLLAARAVGPTGRVVAFDPDPANAASIGEQIALNGFDHASIVQMAVSDRIGRTFLYRRFPGDAAAGIAPLSAEGCDGERLEVETISLDEASRRHGPPDLVKLDVEGAETRALVGAREILATGRTNFLIEWCSLEGLSILAAAGYRLETLDGHPVTDLTRQVHHLVANGPA